MEKATKLEILKAKLTAIELIEDRITYLKRYDIRTPEKGYEMDEDDLRENSKTEALIRGLTYIIDTLAS